MRALVASLPAILLPSGMHLFSRKNMIQSLRISLFLVSLASILVAHPLFSQRLVIDDSFIELETDQLEGIRLPLFGAGNFVRFFSLATRDSTPTDVYALADFTKVDGVSVGPILRVSVDGKLDKDFLADPKLKFDEISSLTPLLGGLVVRMQDETSFFLDTQGSIIFELKGNVIAYAMQESMALVRIKDSSNWEEGFYVVDFDAASMERINSDSEEADINLYDQVIGVFSDTEIYLKVSDEIGQIVKFDVKGRKDNAFQTADYERVFVFRKAGKDCYFASTSEVSENGGNIEYYINRINPNGSLISSFSLSAGFINDLYARSNGSIWITYSEFSGSRFVLRSASSAKIAHFSQEGEELELFVNSDPLSPSSYKIIPINDNVFLFSGFSLFRTDIYKFDHKADARFDNLGSVSSFSSQHISGARFIRVSLGDIAIFDLDLNESISFEERILARVRETKTYLSPSSDSFFAWGPFNIANGFERNGLAKFNEMGEIDALFNPNEIFENLYETKDSLLSFNGSRVVRIGMDGKRISEDDIGFEPRLTQLKSGRLIATEVVQHPESNEILYRFHALNSEGLVDKTLPVEFKRDSSWDPPLEIIVPTSDGGFLMNREDRRKYVISSDSFEHPIKFNQDAEIEREFIISDPLLMRHSRNEIKELLPGLYEFRGWTLNPDGSVNLERFPLPENIAEFKGRFALLENGRIATPRIRYNTDGSFDYSHSFSLPLRPNGFDEPLSYVLPDGSVIWGSRKYVPYDDASFVEWSVGEPRHGLLVASSDSERILLWSGFNHSGARYQWVKDGEPISGANGTELEVNYANSSHSGTYQMRVTVEDETFLSDEVSFNFEDKLARLSNLSARGYVESGSGTLVGGLAVSNDARNDFLFRAVGPGLAQFGVDPALTSASLRVVAPDAEALFVDDVVDPVAIADDERRSGAFPLSPGSGDAAIAFLLKKGLYTLSVEGSESNTGISLIEVYDTANASIDYFRKVLLNLSARGLVRPGEGALILGFVVDGDEPLPILVRGVGPELMNYGIESPLEDPRIVVFKNGEEFDSNDDWVYEGSRILTQSRVVGAFDISQSEKEAALILELEKGVYTVILEDVQGGEGVGLLEVYDLSQSTLQLN